MGARRRCCCGACFEFIDYFYRDDSTNLGDDWAEIDGNWEIKSNHLYQSGTPNSFVVCQQKVPVRSAGEMYVAVTASDFVAGQECEIYAAYDEDSDTYWKGVYTKDNSTAGGTWTVKLYKNTDLLDTATMNPMPWFQDWENMAVSDTDHVRCWICVDHDGNAKAGIISGSEPCWSIENGGLVGRAAALGHPNSVETYLDDFFIAELHDQTHECEACWCHCCGNLLAPRLNAVITGATGRAACLEGDEVELVWDWDGGLQDRKGVITHVRGLYTNTFDISIKCDGNGEDTECTGQNIRLELISQCAEVGGFVCSTSCTAYPTTDSSCEPLNLIFGPYLLKSTMLACSACYGPGFPMPGEPTEGEFYIVITETSAEYGAAFEDGGLWAWEDGTLRDWES
jgi:hypothetical protein